MRNGKSSRSGYFAVSTCIASNSLFLITRGPVWKAVRATRSIPGLLPPVYCEDGRVLVDGSLLDNVPVKSMRALKSGPNVVIGLKSDELRGDTVDYAALPSRGQMLRQMLNPFAPPAPQRPRRRDRAPAQPDGAARAPVKLARARRPACHPPSP